MNVRMEYHPRTNTTLQQITVQGATYVLAEELKLKSGKRYIVELCDGNAMLYELVAKTPAIER